MRMYQVGGTKEKKRQRERDRHREGERVKRVSTDLPGEKHFFTAFKKSIEFLIFLSRAQSNKNQKNACEWKPPFPHV